jgi:phenylalanyl-tRNA synthetase beta chain
VDAIERVGDWWDPEFDHRRARWRGAAPPDADRLVLVDVEFGGRTRQRVVTGAPNLFYKGKIAWPARCPRSRSPFARAGAVLVDAYSDQRPRPKKTQTLQDSRRRSSGMVCSERELGLSEEHEGILLLPEDAPVGMPLRDYWATKSWRST